MDIWQAIILGIVEGLTEFLPISSTGHLIVVSEFMGLDASSPEMIAFFAIIQGGAILSILIYFFKDIVRISVGWSQGIFSLVTDRINGTVSTEKRGADYRFGWYVIVGSIPIAVAGLLLDDHIDKVMNLWTVGIGMIGWSFVMWFAERAATQQRSEIHVNMKDAIFVGCLQVIALFPGVSRSGATMTGGLLRDLDRVTATRLAFFLGIPALVGAGALQMKDAFGGSVSGVALVVGIIVSAVMAYVSVAWLMKFVSNHTFMPFVWYRIAFGGFILVIAGTGIIAA